MKRFVTIAAATTLFSGLALAEAVSGTLVDVMCKEKGVNVATHARKCAIGCSKSGYGLVTADGKFLKFDDAGNEKALAALKASTKDNDLKATVNGKVAGESITVESISLN